MSDHQVVIANIDLKAKIHPKKKKKPGLVHLRLLSALWSGCFLLDTFPISILHLNYSKRAIWMDWKKTSQTNLETEWTNEGKHCRRKLDILKKITLQSTKELISQKTIGSKQHVPCISTHIKRLIRQNQRKYNAVKNTIQRKSWTRTKRRETL